MKEAEATKLNTYFVEVHLAGGGQHQAYYQAQSGPDAISNMLEDLDQSCWDWEVTFQKAELTDAPGLPMPGTNGRLGAPSPIYTHRVRYRDGGSTRHTSLADAEKAAAYFATQWGDHASIELI